MCLGLFLVASNAQGLLEAYPLVAVPLFVFMANILERSGVAEDLFDAMSMIGGQACPAASRCRPPWSR